MDCLWAGFKCKAILIHICDKHLQRLGKISTELSRKLLVANFFKRAKFTFLGHKKSLIKRYYSNERS